MLFSRPDRAHRRSEAASVICDRREDRRSGAIGRLLVLFLLSQAEATAAMSGITSLEIVGDAGDWVSKGEPYSYTPSDASFITQHNVDGGVWIFVRKPYLTEWWQIGFAAPLGAPLEPGLYPEATRYPFQLPSDPGLSVVGNGWGCNKLTGQFEVLEARYGGAGELVAFRARFEQYCDDQAVALRGEIRLDAEVHVEIQAPRRVVGPVESPLSARVSGVALDGNGVALSALGLPDGAVFTDHGDGTGELRWTPPASQVGSHTVTFTGQDVAGGIDSVTTTILIGRTVHVPADHATIQGAMDAAPPGSRVIVGPGTYVENLVFSRQPIRVESEAGPDATIIDGNSAGPVVVFRAGADRDSVLDGFTLRNGFSAFSGPYDGRGHGIYVGAAAPTILNNHITAEGHCAGGIFVWLGAPLIQGNVITGDYEGGCRSGASGVYILDYGRAEIFNNLIADNITFRGAGLYLQDTSKLRIAGNSIVGNFAAEGGGVYLLGESGAEITGNLITGNTAFTRGGGVSWYFHYGQLRPRFLNNTIAANDGVFVSGVDGYSIDVPAELINNVIVGVEGQPAMYCDGAGAFDVSRFHHNDVFAPGGSAYGGYCTDPTGTNGNISTDPGFQCQALGDFRPGPGSEVIDAGKVGIEPQRTLDLAGGPRRLDGNADGVTVVDAGAYEFDPNATVNPCVYVFCPDDIAVVAALGRRSAPVAYPPPSGSPGASVSCTKPSGAEFPGGTTEVTCTASDQTGHSGTCTFEVEVTVPAPNDNFSSPTRITALPFVDRIDTSNATRAGDDPVCSGPFATVWYTFTASAELILVADASGSSYEAGIAAVTGERGSLQPLACGLGSISINIRAGQTVHFAVGSAAAGGDLAFKLSGRSPLRLGLRIDPLGTMSADGGQLMLHGTATCNRSATVALSGVVRGGREPQPVVPQSFSLQLTCEGRGRWEAHVPSPEGLPRRAVVLVEISAEAEDQHTGDRAVDQRIGKVTLRFDARRDPPRR